MYQKLKELEFQYLQIERDNEILFDILNKYWNVPPEERDKAINHELATGNIGFTQQATRKLLEMEKKIQNNKYNEKWITIENNAYFYSLNKNNPKQGIPVNVRSEQNIILQNIRRKFTDDDNLFSMMPSNSGQYSYTVVHPTFGKITKFDQLYTDNLLESKSPIYSFQNLYSPIILNKREIIHSLDEFQPKIIAQEKSYKDTENAIFFVVPIWERTNALERFLINLELVTLSKSTTDNAYIFEELENLLNTNKLLFKTKIFDSLKKNVHVLLALGENTGISKIEQFKSNNPDANMNYIFPKNNSNIRVSLAFLRNLGVAGVIYQMYQKKSIDSKKWLESNFYKRYKEIIEKEMTIIRSNGMQYHSELISHPIIIILDVDLIFNEEFLFRVKGNTEQGRKVYFPIVMSGYSRNPTDISSQVYYYRTDFLELHPINIEFLYNRKRENSPNNIPFNLKNNGSLIGNEINKFNYFWRQHGYGICAVFLSDIVDLGGYNDIHVEWGMEDVV